MLHDKSSDPETVFNCYNDLDLSSQYLGLGLLLHALRSLPRQLLTTSCEQILLGSERDLFPSAGLLVVPSPIKKKMSGTRLSLRPLSVLALFAYLYSVYYI